MRGIAAEEGVDSSKLEVITSMCVNLTSDERKAAEEAEKYLIGYYRQHWWGDPWGPYGPPERTIEHIRRLAQTGVVDTVIVRLASFDQEAQLDIFLNEVMPAVR